MFDDEEEDNGFFLLVLGVLAAVLLIVTVVARAGGDLPAATVTGDDVSEETGGTHGDSDDDEDTATTEAPTTTQAGATTEAPTTTQAPARAAVTLWDALGESGEAQQFMTIGGALGLRADLEALEDADGNAVSRTLFAPSNEALAKLSPAELGAIASDEAGANALVGYHFLEGVVTAEDLIALDGQTVATRTGLPLAISVVDGDVYLNGTSKVTSVDVGADNGTVHIIDTLLTPPTVNEVIGLENIEFEVSSAVITAAGQDELQKAVAFFAEQEGVNAVIEGHTDTDGSEEGNLTLSQSRAEAVLGYLVDNGIDAGRLQAIGFGESEPVLVDGVEDKEASRRIEFNAR